MRFLFLLHRYLGIAVGLLMAMWCLSGIVMMYVGYPALSPAERVKGLAALDWSRCCHAVDLPGLDGDSEIRGFQIEMLDADPVLRLVTAQGRRRVVDLADGREISPVAPAQAAAAALGFARSARIAETPSLLGMVDQDQWTVGGFGGDKPLYHFALNDPAITELYVSSTTGRAVQRTTADERFWNWLGAIPHWLYPTMLRQNPQLWSQIVDWTSLLGCFLTATGLYLGVVQLKWRRSTNRLASPYRGILFLHHVPGLIFGVFALTWVASGLFSMNPWGLWEGGGDGRERQQLAGAAPDWQTVKETLPALAAAAPAGIVSLDAAPYEGKLFFVAESADGTRRRLDAQGVPAPLTKTDLGHIAAVLGAGDASASAGMLDTEDAYYFSHHDDVVSLPVFRVLRGDETHWRYYVDPLSGALLGKIDGDAKLYRWFHEGLHRLDFAPWLRARPVWDLVTLPLLLGVTFLCLIGAYLGLRSLLWKKGA